MKITKLLTIISILLLFSQCTENKIKTDLTKENLKGRVKSIKETPYHVVEKFGEVTKGDINIEGGYLTDDYWLLLSSIWHKTYNEIGFEMETKKYDANGNTLKRSVCNYDEKGKLIDWKSYNTKGLESKTTYKYDEKGNQIESNSYNPKGELEYKNTYKYDDKGNQIEDSWYNNRELNRKYTSKYNKKGIMIERNGYNFNGELDFKGVFTYDDKGNKIEMNSYNTDGQLKGRHTYKYDDKGNEIEKSEYSYEYSFIGELVKTESFKFKYDHKGNWIEKIEYENDIPQRIFEREIEYY